MEVGSADQSRIEAGELSRIPSASYMGLSLAIVKCLPPGLTMRDFLQALKDRIAGAASPADARNLDTATFWKHQFEDLHKQYCKLKDENAQLMAVDRSEELHETIQALCGHVDKVSGIGESMSRRIPDASNAIIGQETISCLPLLLAANTLHRQVEDTRTSSTVLLLSMRSSLQQLSRLLRLLCSRQWDNSEQSYDENLHRNITIIHAVYQLCLKAIYRLCGDIVGRQNVGAATSDLVKCFDIVMDEIHQAASSTTESMAHPADSGTEGILSTQPGFQNALLLTLSRILLGFLKNPIFTNLVEESSDSVAVDALLQVYHGSLALLLRRVGRVISKDVFGEAISDSDRPAKISNLNFVRTTPEMKAANRCEGSTYAFIMKEILDDAKCSPLRLLGRVQTGADEIDTCLEKAKVQLDNTLLAATFGEDGKIFLESLKCPTLPEWQPLDLGASKDFVSSICASLRWEGFSSQWSLPPGHVV